MRGLFFQLRPFKVVIRCLVMFVGELRGDSLLSHKPQVVPPIVYGTIHPRQCSLADPVGVAPHAIKGLAP